MKTNKYGIVKVHKRELTLWETISNIRGTSIIIQNTHYSISKHSFFNNYSKELNM